MKPFGKEHNQAVLRNLHDMGIEMTPDELDEMRREAYAKIRMEMKAKGHSVPDSDEGMFKLMRKMTMEEQESRNLEMLERSCERLLKLVKLKAPLTIIGNELDLIVELSLPIDGEDREDERWK